TQAMPTGVLTFGERDGVWICSPSHAVAVAGVLRTAVLEVAAARRSVEGHAEKMERLYEYLTSSRCKLRLQGAIEAVMAMQQDLLREQSAMKSSWKRRETQLQRIAT